MNSRQAFRTLLAGVETALEKSLARHRAATQQGDFDTMEVELERQKNLVSARQQLEGLQELWPRLVGEHQSARRSKRAKPLTIPAEGLPIFARYKGRRFEAVLLPDHHVRFGEKEYGSPSGAGLVIVDSKTLNGWRFWHYVDDKGLEHPISDLRG